MKSMPRKVPRVVVADDLDWIASHLDDMMILDDEAKDLGKDNNPNGKNNKTKKITTSPGEKQGVGGEADNNGGRSGKIIIDLDADEVPLPVHQPRKRKRVQVFDEFDGNDNEGNIADNVNDLNDDDNSPPTKRRKKIVEPTCKICLDTIDPADALTPCRFKKHLYCAECLQNHILISTGDESLYPPRCCKNAKAFGQDVMEKVLTEQQMEQYKNAGEEYAIAFDERLYCPNAKCGKFIQKGRDDYWHKRESMITCEKCGTDICTHCMAVHHGQGIKCTEKTRDEAFIKMAEKSKWKPCPRCKKITSKNGGCNYVYCPCGKNWNWTTGK